MVGSMAATYPKQLEPIYRSDAASAETPLWGGRVHLKANGEVARGPGRIVLAWKPDKWIAWDALPAMLMPAVANAQAGIVMPWGMETSAPYVGTGVSVQSSPMSVRMN